jgi:ligand-binding sensor domain-containing protein/two-component sensor histidine kinase
MEDGLPHTIVQAIAQTRDGYLWVGTREGLARFDGVRFMPVEFPGQEAHPSIASLCEGRDDSLWIATHNAGLFRWQSGRLSHYGGTNGLASEDVVAVQADPQGTLWIATPQGVARWEESQARYVKELGSGVWSIFAGGAGDLWVASGQGVKRLKDQRIRTYTTADGLLSQANRSLFCGPSGAVWVGSQQGLTRIKDEILTRYPGGEGPPAKVDALLEDRAGTVWVGTYGGLYQLAEGRFINVSEVGSYRVYAIIQDREGNLWVGSEEGLARLVFRNFMTYTRQEGLTYDKITSVCGGRDGSIWIGTWGGGVDQLQEGEIRAYTTGNGLTSDYVYSVHEGEDGSLWVGLDYGQGLDRLKKGKFTHFGRSEGLDLGPGDSCTVRVIDEDEEGDIWVGTRYGLYRLQKGKLVRYHTKDDLADPDINALCRGRGRCLWIGTNRGLTCWRDGRMAGVTVNGELFQDRVYSLHEDAVGTLWIGTWGKGLKRLKQGKLDAWTTREGLLSDVIYAILEDDRNNLWLSSSKGIFRVSKGELDLVTAGNIPAVTAVGYGKADGILSSSQATEVAQPGAWKGADGRLWFKTTQGLVVTDPNRITPNQLPPPVVIEQVIADNRTVASVEGRRMGVAFLDPRHLSVVTVPPGRGQLEIYFTALSLRAPEQNRFKYKLEGVDPDWVERQPARVAYYNNLAPGDYRFQVTACNNDGVWNDTDPATISLVLRPHYWQTWWFLGACAVSAAAGIAGTARYVTRSKMQIKLERLERQNALEKERARVARDLHDGLGADLANILLLGEQIEREGTSLAETKAQARHANRKVQQAIQVMDQMVWAVNPANDSLANLADYLSDYAQECLRPFTGHCRLDVAEGLPKVALTSQIRHDLLLAVKEALNNTVKHSGASDVWLRIHCVADELCITVEDNGRGFNPAVGDGLGNMRRRLADLGGRAEIASRPGQGTLIRFTLPLPGAESAAN